MNKTEQIIMSEIDLSNIQRVWECYFHILNRSSVKHFKDWPYKLRHIEGIVVRRVRKSDKHKTIKTIITYQGKYLPRATIAPVLGYDMYDRFNDLVPVEIDPIAFDKDLEVSGIDANKFASLVSTSWDDQQWDLFLEGYKGAIKQFTDRHTT
ncbi:hypothetical protein AB4304_13915 [Vibrio breoganii]